MTNIGYAGLTGSALRLQKEEKASISVMRLSHADMEVYTDIEKEPAGGQFTHRLQKRRSSPAEIR